MIAEIKKELDKNNVIIGYKEVVKAVKNNLVTKVFFASNIEDHKKEELDKYCKITKVDLTDINLPNDELGIVCKKAFHISALAIKK